MNSFNKNKEIIKLCKHYYDIVNYEIEESDKVTRSIIKIYVDYIFSLDNITSKEVEKIKKLDSIIYKYLNDKRFKKEIVRDLTSLKVTSAVTNLVEYVVNKIISYFEDYTITCTRIIYVPKWI